MKITVAQAKRIREQLNATHVVILARDENGDCVSTHGKTFADAKDASGLGNKLKRLLRWPESHCDTKPLERICGNCAYWSEGYTAPGHAHYEDAERCGVDPVKIPRRGKEKACRLFEPNC